MSFDTRHSRTRRSPSSTFSLAYRPLQLARSMPSLASRMVEFLAAKAAAEARASMRMRLLDCVCVAVLQWAPASSAQAIAWGSTSSHRKHVAPFSAEGKCYSAGIDTFAYQTTTQGKK